MFIDIYYLICYIIVEQSSKLPGCSCMMEPSLSPLPKKRAQEGCNFITNQVRGYRTRRKFGKFRFNLECSATDAHLIPEEKRMFEYPKVKTLGSCNFRESNVPCPASMKQPSTNELITKLNAYLASLFAEVQNV